MDTNAGSRLSFSTVAAAIGIAAYLWIALSPVRAFMPGVSSIDVLARAVAPLLASPVSEPLILALFGSGLILAAARLRRRKEV